MRDSEALASTSSRWLVARPQRLGVLPTLWFWRDPDNWRVVRWPNLALVMSAAFGAMAIVPSFWAGLAAGSVAQYLGLGLFERYIRGRALRGGAEP